MSKTTIIVLVLIMPISLWINMYVYYKYGKSLGRTIIKSKKNNRKGGGE